MLSVAQRLVLNISWMCAPDDSIYRQMFLAYRRNEIKEKDIKELLTAYLQYKDTYEDVVEEYEDGMYRDTASDRYLEYGDGPGNAQVFAKYPKWRP